MPLELPLYVYLTFYFATGLTCFLFFRATRYNRTVIAVVCALLLIHGILGYVEFYLNLDARPPRFLLLLPPTLILIVLLFSFKKTRLFIDSIDHEKLTLVHLIRIPIELSLYWIYLGGYMPEIMTFSGQNFDILAGLTAPIIFYFGFKRKTLHKSYILLWNILSLALLMNIVIIAILAAPLPFQQICFDSPNIGILYFPFLWLASVIVPIVLFSHIIQIRHFFMNKG